MDDRSGGVDQHGDSNRRGGRAGVRHGQTVRGGGVAVQGYTMGKQSGAAGWRRYPASPPCPFVLHLHDRTLGFGRRLTCL